MTIEEVSGILTREEIKHIFDKDGDICAGWDTEKFINSKGEKSVRITLGIRNEGQVFHACVYHAFQLKGCKHLDAFFKLCSIIQYGTFFSKFEYSVKNASVSLRIEIPLFDNKLTREQINACWTTLIKILEDHYDALRKALDTGELDLPDEIKKAMTDNESGETDSL